MMTILTMIIKMKFQKTLAAEETIRLILLGERKPCTRLGLINSNKVQRLIFSIFDPNHIFF